MPSSTMLLLNLISLIDVTFSTPTGVFTQNPAGSMSEIAILQQLPLRSVFKVKNEAR